MHVTTIESDKRGDEKHPGSAPRRLRPLTFAAVASLSAGAINAAAIGAHAEHPQAAKVFALVALLQLSWGGLALVRRDRAFALIGVMLNGALFGGWALAKWKGLSFIDGLDDPEPVQFADGLCAALALLSALAAAAVFLQFRLRSSQPHVAMAAVVVLGLASLPGMVEAGRHVHALTVVKAAPKIATATAALPVAPYDPKRPIDLAGVKGVTQRQQARAENLVADTLIRLPQWSHPARAEDAGYVTLTGSATGFKQLVNWSYLHDKRMFDPNHPEGLMYQVRRGRRRLVSAIYMLAPGANLNRLPDVGGPLIHWDPHADLCATTGAAPHIAGFTSAKGTCRQGQRRLEPVPTLHVWIVAHPCGPFALNPDGEGQVRPTKVPVCPIGHASGGSNQTL